MKNSSATSRLIRRALAVLLALAIATTGLWTGGVAAVQAASNPMQAEHMAGLYQGKVNEERADRRLQHLLTQELLLLSIQEDRLQLAREEAANAQQRIDEEKTAGKDTTAIQSALDTFKSQIEVAQSFWNTARSILDAKAGFDANGQVVDREQARETLREADRALRDAGHTLRDAAAVFRRAVRDYWRSQRE
jgi:membrane-associated HD superfamily phosphohydrolase